MYDESAAHYAKMMDAEIQQPMYDDKLGRLADRIQGLSGLVVDTSCGSGHMLARFRDLDPAVHGLVGVDLSPKMIDEARRVVGGGVELVPCDMREVAFLERRSAAAVISFFALHHLDIEDALRALREWSRILKAGGRLLLATWEGEGNIDYGEHADIDARNYTEEQVRTLVESAGFKIDQITTEPVADMDMDAIYVEATKKP